MFARNMTYQLAPAKLLGKVQTRPVTHHPSHPMRVIMITTRDIGRKGSKGRENSMGWQWSEVPTWT
jgi:hypothetical protein